MLPDGNVNVYTSSTRKTNQKANAEEILLAMYVLKITMSKQGL